MMFEHYAARLPGNLRGSRDHKEPTESQRVHFQPELNSDRGYILSAVFSHLLSPRKLVPSQYYNYVLKKNQVLKNGFQFNVIKPKRK